MFEKFKLKRKISKLKKLVKKNDADAMYELALIYYDGSIIKADKQYANELMQKSADLGNIEAKSYIITNKISNTIKVGVKAIKDIVDSAK